LDLLINGANFNTCRNYSNFTFHIFLHKAWHEKPTQKFSPFYPTPIITYEIGKKPHQLTISEKGKQNFFSFPSANSLSFSLTHPRPNSSSHAAQHNAGWPITDQATPTRVPTAKAVADR
jgi:hypothetical protein